MKEEHKIIAGIDEAGRGPLAGPVVAAAVILPNDFFDPEIRDSKKLSAKKREGLFRTIKEVALAYSIVAVGQRRIDRFNIREATRLAMGLALKRVALKIKPDLVLIDGDMTTNLHAFTQKAVVGGDDLHIQISAASILAKVWRDNLMQKLDQRYPNYSFSKHAGYPTKEHKRLISVHGPCPVHRRFFRGVSEFL
jgi:ribonuclease HII